MCVQQLQLDGALLLMHLHVRVLIHLKNWGSVDEALVQPDERSCQSLPTMPLFCGRDYEEAGLLEH